ncbi:type II toxin-antitoxin system RelE/ParE family toxin [Anaerolineae bacterium CFX7]|nr:type II toxin-antitoxin system RelE/ParE family toxin [Anaerolineae bacterium CFX7]
MASSPQRWSVVYYQDAQGRRPAQEFLLSLSATARAAVFHDINQLEEFGLLIGAPTVRPIEGIRKLWELRVKTADGAVRLFYVARTERRFVILHGFIKKTAKTPQKELNLARKRLREVLAEEN